METFVDQRSSFESKRDTTGLGMSPWLRKGLLVFGAVLMVGMAIGAGLRFASAAPAPYVGLPQSVAPQVASAYVTGSLSGAQRMTIAVTLQSRSEAMLKAYAADVAKPHSRAFHQYLTPAQFALNFGPDHATLNAVERYFQSQGLHLDSATSGGLFLQFTGNVAQVESALHTHINTYRAPNGRTFFANATAIEVPSALAPAILDVAGTENARVSHPAGALSTAHHGADLARSNVRRPSIARPNVSVTCPTAPTISGAAAPFTAAGLLPTQFNNVYNFQNSTNPGNGMWAAFVEMDGYSLSDLAQYANCVGISSAIQSAITGSSSSSTPFIITQNVSNGGGNAVTATPGANYGTPLTAGANAVSVEEELELVLGLVPNITHISVIQTANSTLGIQTALSTIATENAAQVVGYQWGMCEADAGFSNASAEEQFFMQMVLQGQSVLAATGNNGLYACSGDGNNFRQFGFAVQDPASDPFVTAVGGTELGLSTSVASTAKWAAEQPWNNYPQNGSLAAGGAGISQFWAAPTWQQNAKAATITANSTGLAYTGVASLYNPNTTSTANLPSRIVPDVSAAADPVNSSAAIYCSVGSSCTSGATTFSNVGGTTEAEAIWAAATIEANQTSGAPSTGAGGRLSDIAPALYALYQQDTTQNTPYLTLNTINYCDYANQLGSVAINTTASTGVAVGAVTVVPASMTGIINGMKVSLPGNTGLTVSNVTSSSFQVTIGATNVAGATITPSYLDTISTATFGPGTVSVAVTSTATLVVGQYLLIDPGASSSEIVQVSAITDATHFTATFLKAHATAANNVEGTFANATSVANNIAQATTTTTYELGGAGQTAVTPASMTGIVTGASLNIAAPNAETVTATVPAGANYFVATFANTHAVGVAITGGGHALAGTAASFALACASAANFVLNDSTPLASSATTFTSSFPQNATYNYQQLPGTATALYGSQAGFSVKGNYAGAGNSYISGYNALTGLGSPNAGNTSSTGGQLLGYLTQQGRLAQSRVYMVAQGLSDNKYWIASYSTNPYVQDMTTATAWYPLNTVAFSGPPILLDDNNANPQNLLILGPAMPTATGLAMYNWNIATATATQMSLAGGNLPGAYAGSTTSCTSISGATDGTSGAAANNIGVYCVTASGALYSTKIAITRNAQGVTTSATASNWTNSPLLNTVSYAPQIASDNAGNYLVLETNTGGAGVYYQYFAGVGGAGIAFNSTAAIALFPSASGASSGLSPFSFGAPLATTCLTTPSAAYVAVSKMFAVACTASDTKQMWDNVYFPGNGKFNGQWSLLGQPSTSVTFMPGNAVAVDNYAADQSYGQIFYIAEGSDKAMYLESVNATAARFLGKSTGWMSVSLAGIFNSNSAADFVNA
jgi:hypothetical protein